jgi:hypothetical protein
MRHYIDDVIQIIPVKIMIMLNWLMTITAALTLIDWMAIGIRTVTGFITIGVGLLSFRYYMLRNRGKELDNKLKEKEIEIKDQELYARIQELSEKKKNSEQDLKALSKTIDEVGN